TRRSGKAVQRKSAGLATRGLFETGWLPKACRDLSDPLLTLQVPVLRMSLPRNRFPLSGDILQATQLRTQNRFHTFAEIAPADGSGGFFLLAFLVVGLGAALG